MSCQNSLYSMFTFMLYFKNTESSVYVHARAHEGQTGPTLSPYTQADKPGKMEEPI